MEVAEGSVVLEGHLRHLVLGVDGHLENGGSCARTVQSVGLTSMIKHLKKNCLFCQPLEKSSLIQASN